MKKKGLVGRVQIGASKYEKKNVKNITTIIRNQLNPNVNSNI